MAHVTIGTKLPSVYLLDIIGHDKADHAWYGKTEGMAYLDWEATVAIPAILNLGDYKIYGSFVTLERDSCGPLSRGIVVEKNGVKSMAWYG
jgi:hypothetical protein